MGADHEAGLRATDIALDSAGRPSFTVEGDGLDGQTRVSLPLHGEHHVGNALAVIAVALECGLPVADITAALATATPASRWRMEVTERPDGVTVVNDAYNANPDSMRAALKALVAMGHGRRTWAVLGSMLELGTSPSPSTTPSAGLPCGSTSPGSSSWGRPPRPMASGAQHEGSWGDEVVWVPDADAAYELLSRELSTGDVVLLKSSRDAGLRWLGDRLAGPSAPDSMEDAT